MALASRASGDCVSLSACDQKAPERCFGARTLPQACRSSLTARLAGQPPNSSMLSELESILQNPVSADPHAQLGVSPPARSWAPWSGASNPAAVQDRAHQHLQALRELELECSRAGASFLRCGKGDARLILGSPEDWQGLSQCAASDELMADVCRPHADVPIKPAHTPFQCSTQYFAVSHS